MGQVDATTVSKCVLEMGEKEKQRGLHTVKRGRTGDMIMMSLLPPEAMEILGQLEPCLGP